jgi:Holliday junction resolvase RusA-like endonuclease
MNVIYAEGMKIKLASVNNKYISRSFVLTKAYRQFKELLQAEVRMKFWKKGVRLPSKKKVLVAIIAGTTKDIDNIIKPILDALQGILIVDDRQVVHIDARKVPKKTKAEYLGLEVIEVEDDDGY